MPDNSGGILGGLLNGYNNWVQQGRDQNLGIQQGLLAHQDLLNRQFQMQLFQSQLEDFMRNNPGAGLNQALYGTSEKGLQGQYGTNFGPSVEAGSAKAPIVYGNGQPPHLFNVGPQSPQQGQPTQQPTSAIDNLTNVAADTERKIAAAKSKGEEEGSAQTNVQGSVDQINRSISLIDELSNHPGMKWATGLLGSVPPLPNTAGYSFVKGLDQLKDQLTLDILPSLQRKGNRISPALIDLLQKSTAGQELDRSSPDFPRALQNTKAALLQIRAATEKMANVPITPAETLRGAPLQTRKRDKKALSKTVN